MILSCPGKGYRVGSPIVAPNYVKLQIAIKKTKKHYMQWKRKAMTVSNWYGLYHGVYSQSAQFHSYSVSVHCPTSTCFTRIMVILYSYKNAVGIVVPGTYSHSCTTQLLGLPDNFI